MYEVDYAPKYITDAHTTVGKPSFLGEFNTSSSTRSTYWPAIYSTIEANNGDADAVLKSADLVLRYDRPPGDHSGVTQTKDRAPQNNRPEALLIGGRAGVGKTTAGWEVSAQLQAARIAHAHVDGDNLDQIFPAPAQDPARTRITEANLAALWRNYTALGCRRLIYTNTVSVLEPDLIARAMGGTPRIIAVLLTADDATARQRLSGREIGSQLDAHLVRGAKMAAYLETTAPTWVHRIPTDGRSAVDIARDIITTTGWSPDPA